MRRPPLFDVLLTAVLIGLGVAEAVVPFSSRQGTGSVLVTAVGVVVLTLPIVGRRQFPLLGLLAVCIGWPLLSLVAPVYVLFYGQFVIMGVATYSVARWGQGRTPFYGAAIRVATLVLGNLVVPELRGPSEAVFDWGVSLLAWGAGFGLRLYQQRAAENLRRAVDSEVTAAAQAMAAVADERARIARELHDIVAHSVSLIVVQAGAAEQVVDDDPAYVVRALGNIRTTGAGALAEMRRVVTTLREAGDDWLAPPPGVDQIAALAQQASSPHIEVGFEVTGPPRPLPLGVELAAYRIVQEALTNVRRHASATRVSVRLQYRPEDLRVDVEDNGRGMADAPLQQGHGLVGMRERVAIHGGHLETGVGAGQQGLLIRATLPTA